MLLQPFAANDEENKKLMYRIKPRSALYYYTLRDGETANQDIVLVLSVRVSACVSVQSDNNANTAANSNNCSFVIGFLSPLKGRCVN